MGLKHTFGLCLAWNLVLSVLPSAIYVDQQLYEGSKCTLSDGNGEGTCVKLFDCPSQIEAIHEGRFVPVDRCGFINDTTEIVCCGQVNISDKLKNSGPAEAACHEYENEISQINESRISFLILDGEDAKSREFPSMVALGYARRPEDDGEGDIKYTCGGTLISRQHVLTAAHCVSNRDEEVPIKVRLGSTDLTIDENSTQYAEVLNVTTHPKYKRSENYNDIAIIKLRDQIRLTSSVHPACLLTKPLETLDDARNDTLVVLGWGVTEFLGDPSPKLKKAVGLRFIDIDDCSKSYSINARLPTGLDNSMVCAAGGNRTHRPDTCQGDSGGPLLLCPGNSQPLVAGVTAFGQACGGSTPSVYTSVANYLGWIEKHVWLEPETEGSTRVL